MINEYYAFIGALITLIIALLMLFHLAENPNWPRKSRKEGIVNDAILQDMLAREEKQNE